MFDSLSDRLGDVFKRFSGKGKLSKDDVEAGLREVRMALLEADVNFKVARAFVERIRERLLHPVEIRFRERSQAVPHARDTQAAMTDE